MGDPYDLHVEVVGEGSIGVVELTPGFKQQYPHLEDIRMVIVSQLKQDFSEGFIFQRKGRDVSLAAESRAPLTHCLQRTGPREYVLRIRRGAEVDDSPSPRGSTLSLLPRRKSTEKKPEPRPSVIETRVESPMYWMQSMNVFKKRLGRLEDGHFLCTYSYTKEAAKGNLGPNLNRIDLRHVRELSPPTQQYGNQPDGYYMVQLKIERREQMHVGIPSEDPHFDLVIMAIKHTESLTKWLSTFHRICRFPAVRYEIDPESRAWRRPATAGEAEDAESTGSSLPPGMFDVYDLVVREGGIGMSIAQYGKTATVDRVVGGSQAAKGGVSVGDVVLKIGSKVVQGMSWEKVSEMLHSAPKPVKVTLGKKAGMPGSSLLDNQNTNTGYGSFVGFGGQRLSITSVMTANETLASQGSVYQRNLQAIGGSVEQSLQRQLAGQGPPVPRKHEFNFDDSPTGRQRAYTNQVGGDHHAKGGLTRALMKLTGHAVDRLHAGKKKNNNNKGRKGSMFSDAGDQLTEILGSSTGSKLNRMAAGSIVSESTTSTHSSYDTFENKGRKMFPRSPAMTPTMTTVSKHSIPETVEERSLTLAQIKTIIHDTSIPVTNDNFEHYLTDHEFESLFKIPRDVYEKLPQYKRAQKKGAITF